MRRAARMGRLRQPQVLRPALKPAELRWKAAQAGVDYPAIGLVLAAGAGDGVRLTQLPPPEQLQHAPAQPRDGDEQGVQAIRRSLRDSWFSEASHSDGDTQVQGGGKDEAGGAESGASLVVDIQALQDCIMHRGDGTASEKCADMSAERQRSETHSPCEQASQEQPAATTGTSENGKEVYVLRHAVVELARQRDRARQQVEALQTELKARTKEPGSWDANELLHDRESHAVDLLSLQKFCESFLVFDECI